MLRGVWFVQSVTLQQFSFLYIQTLHNDCSHIKDVHLLFCAHLIIFDYIFWSVEFRHVYVYISFGVLTLFNLSFHSFILYFWSGLRLHHLLSAYIV